MDSSRFRKFIKSLDELTLQQDRILRQHMAKKANKKKVARTLETPYSEQKCPHCGSSKLYRWGIANDMQRYRCKECKRTFNSLTGTPLARLRRKGHWLDYMRCLKEGFSVRKTAELCSVHPNTSFRWRHRFLVNSQNIKPSHLDGIVEAQERYFRCSEKGSRKLNRPARKRGRDGNKKEFKTPKICVFVSRDRYTNTFDAILDRFKASELSNVLKPYISHDALFCSDSRSVFRRYTLDANLRHGRLQLSKGEVVRKDIVHIRNVTHYHNQLYDWLIKRFRGVATKYLPNYLGWIRELDEFENKITPQTLLLRAKAGGKYKIQYLTVTQP